MKKKPSQRAGETQTTTAAPPAPDPIAALLAPPTPTPLVPTAVITKKKLLLDTHCWLWMLSAPEKLSATVRAALEDADGTEVFVSAATAWEIAIKTSIGKLTLALAEGETVTNYVRLRVIASESTPLPINHEHALQVSALPLHHRDPFDRILIAQAMVEPEMHLVTDDENILKYQGVRLIRAR